MNTWHVETNVQGAEIGYRAIVDQDGFTICDPSPMGADNASLISAAPKLLAAVELLLKFFDEMPSGQLGRIVCDIGLLNNALIDARVSVRQAKGDK